MNAKAVAATAPVERLRLGELDVIVVPKNPGDLTMLELRRELLAAINPDTPRLAVDIMALRSVDATLLGMLSDAARMRRRWGGTLEVRCENAAIVRLLRITLLDRLLDVVPAPKKAVAERKASKAA
jgi:anti-anti-sigma regulatory factor